MATIAVVSAAFLGVAGVAFALVGDDGANPQVPAPIVEELADGIAPSGTPFTVARVDADQGSTMLCYEIATKVAKAQGCQPIPDENGQFQGEPVRPGKALLGTDRFVSILAADGVDTMRVVTPGAEASTIEARSIDVDGVGRLLLVPIGGPPVTSETPDPDRTVQLLDTDGRVVREALVPGSGGR